MSEWDRLAEWWIGEAADPAYAEEVHPVLLDLLGPVNGERLLEVGVGEGRVLRLLRDRGAVAVGMDLSPRLAALAGASFVGRLPSLAAVRDGSFDGVVVALVLEHLPSLDGLFEELARVTRGHGRCVLVVNHPLLTAPGAAPVTDPTDGEVFLRPGEYFGSGSTSEPAGETSVRFHHRPLGELLEAAANAGWCLERLTEHGVSASTIERDQGYLGHEHIPRLLGVAWRKR